jgi:hypothetical protein
MSVGHVLSRSGPVGQGEGDGFAPVELLFQCRPYPLAAECHLLDLHRPQFRERLDVPPRQHKRVARTCGTDVEKCHDEVAVEDRARGEFAGEDSTKDT